MLLLIICLPAAARAQAEDPEGRPIRRITLDGLEQIESRYAENQLRSAVGRPYHKPTVEQDVVRLTNLGYFRSVVASVALTEDGGVALTYELDELPVLTGVELRGNRKIPTYDLRPLILLRPGDAVDPFVIERARRAILDAYEAKGYFVTDVSLDERACAKSVGWCFWCGRARGSACGGSNLRATRRCGMKSLRIRSASACGGR